MPRILASQNETIFGKSGKGRLPEQGRLLGLTLHVYD